MGKLGITTAGRNLSYKYANLVMRGFKENDIFELTHPGNRDNCFYPWWLLREKFNALGVQINTADLNVNKRVAFELHVDVQKHKVSIPTYLILNETPEIWPLNASLVFQSRYRLVFSWNDQLVDGNRYIKYHLPVVINSMTFSALGWAGRDRFCCAIAGNKSVRNSGKQELYSKRLETIRWFEQHAPQNFDLYGTGWENPPALPGLLGKLKFKAGTHLYRWQKRHPFPSYSGRVENKYDTLSRYRFSICYENVRDLPGYITEKIFDCFFAGCIPVYWGASNVFDYVPRECFIDRRQFSDHESLYGHLTSMSETGFIFHQQAIQAFLTSKAANRFDAEAFATNVVDTIMRDFDLVK